MSGRLAHPGDAEPMPAGGLLSAYANHVDAHCYYELVLGMLANVPEHRIFAQLI